MNVTETIQRKEMKKMKDDIELILSMLTGGKQKVIKKNSSSRSIDTLGMKCCAALDCLQY